MYHTAIRPANDNELPRTIGERPIADARDFSQLPLHTTVSSGIQTNFTQSCPFSPQRCPFGGACHTCPPRIQSTQSVGMQRKAINNDALSEVPPIVHDVLRSPGQPLDAWTRALLESGFAHDFSKVRVHTDTKAAESANAVNALAYTVGSEVAFASGAYAPTTCSGLRLLAHELAHTMQQRLAGLAQPPQQICLANGSYEAEADRVSQQAMEGGFSQSQNLHALASQGLQRQERPSQPPPLIPQIPIPVFDELDPFVIVPDIPGVPEVLRGQQVKLSTLRSALEVLRGNLPITSTGGTDICTQLLPGYETAPSGEVAGLCCPRFRRERDKCCHPRNIGQLSYRCCTADEVIINNKCIRPRRAVAPPAPAQVEETPTLPRLKLRWPQISFGSIQSDTIDHFALNSDRLPIGATAKLDRLAGQLALYTEAEVHIEGHTDSSYTDTYNQQLSERRAQVVRNALVQRGIEANRLIVTGFGESQLLFPEETTEEEKSRNRRVEVWFYIAPTSGLGEQLRLQPPSISQ